MERRAKIVATLGPASADPAVLERLLAAGVDVVRLNLSHGSHDVHRRLIEGVRRWEAAHQRFVPVIVDLMGPRFRLGEIPGQRVLAEGEELTLGEGADLPVEDPSFLAHLQPGERLLVDNGLIELRILERGPGRVRAKVLSGGPVSTRKGLNLPDTDLPFTITDKDREDIAFAVRERVDYLAVSFVGGPGDLGAVREVVEGAGGDVPLVAKLERAKVISQLEATVAAADAVMVARGDLGVEVPLYQVPVLQKRILDCGRRHGKPVIVATQMLESMIEHPRPTRAEASDVANAVFDGADALMLSGETAAGAHPVAAVRTMAEVIVEAEAYRLPSGVDEGAASASEAAEVVVAAAVHAVERLDVRQLVAFSQGGFTARALARYRPRTPIQVFTPDPSVARRIQLVWGTRPVLMDHEVHHHDEVVRVVDRMLSEAGLVRADDLIVILMGDPIHERPLTNLMRVHRVRPG